MLLTKQDLNVEPGIVPDWLLAACQEYREVLLANAGRDYPCHFGVEGEERGHNRYSFAEEGDPNALPMLAQTLREFLAEVRRHPGVRMSLLVFFKPSEQTRSLAEYRDQFWNILNGLHVHDASPWPDAVPIAVDDPGWEFCFAGEPLFVFGACPAYQQRRSRNLGRSLLLVFQSKAVFHGISGDTHAGQQAKRAIRRRLAKFDRIAPHESLGSAAQSSIEKWKQYFLPDDTEPVSGVCPFTGTVQKGGDPS